MEDKTVYTTQKDFPLSTISLNAICILKESQELKYEIFAILFHDENKRKQYQER